jgi:hypothetical protein
VKAAKETKILTTKEHEEKPKDTKEKSKEILRGKTRFSRLAMQGTQRRPRETQRRMIWSDGVFC